LIRKLPSSGQSAKKRKSYFPTRCGFTFKFHTGMRTTSFSYKHFFIGWGAEKHIIQTEEKKRRVCGLFWQISDSWQAFLRWVGVRGGRVRIVQSQLLDAGQKKHIYMKIDRWFKMKLDDFVPNISGVKCLLFIHVQVRAITTRECFLQFGN